MPVRALVVWLGDHRFGHLRRVANYCHELVRLVPELAMGTTETAGNQQDQTIHHIDLGDCFPSVGWVFAGAETVVDLEFIRK